MTAKTKTEIKAFFETGDMPTEAQFIDLIDSFVDKSGPIGDIETEASGSATGFAFCSGGGGEVKGASEAISFLGLTVYTTAQASAVAIEATRNTFVTTAQASAVASDGIAAAYATTAQANAGAATNVLMNPVLVKNAVATFANIILATPQATTSGTSINFSSIPSGVKKITIMLSGVSTNGSSNVIVQIGDSGGLETNGYDGCVASVGGGAASNLSAGFQLTTSFGATTTLHGTIILTLLNSSTNTWTAIASIGEASPNNVLFSTGGSKSLSAVLDRLTLTTENGTDSFDAGIINIQYES